MRFDKYDGNATLRVLAALWAGIAISMNAGPAFAQGEPAPADEPGQIEEIVVTAQRRAENLQHVPIQVSAFTEKAIEDAGIRSTRDFVDLVPNVSFDESFTYLNSFIVVRGVTQINNADSPLSVVVDGVPQNNQKQLRMNLFDVERIEVLKGPQGGLYGRNAIGGAINIVTRAPSNEFEGFVDAIYGRGDAVEATGAVSGPVVRDVALFRLVGNYKEDGGRIRNSFTGKNSDFVDRDYEVRGKLNVKPTEALDLDFRASYRDFSAGSIYDSIVPSGRANDYRLPNENIEGLTYGDIVDASFKFDIDLTGATLTGISGYTDLTEIYQGDLDFSNPVDKPGGFLGLGIQVGQGQNLGVELLSQELRIVSDDNQPIRWIAGAYYLQTDRQLQTRAFIDLNGSRDQINNPALLLINLREKNDNEAYAVYGQVDLDLSDKVTLSTALRYDSDKREQTNLSNGQVRKRTFDAVQPKATLTYKFTDARLAYLTYSTGFRSGGFNAPTVSIPIFNDETLQNFEAGFKTSWLDRRLVLNGAAYFAKSDGFQFFFIEIASASQVIGNLDKVDIRGVELELQTLVADGLQLSAALGTTDSQIKRAAAFPAAVGNKTPKTTDWTLNAGVQYTRPVAGEINLLLRADYQHRDKKYWQIDNVDVQEPVDTIDLRIGVESERWGLYLTGRNITDEKFYSDYNPREFSGLDVDIGFRGQPANYAVEGTIKF